MTNLRNLKDKLWNLQEENKRLRRLLNKLEKEKKQREDEQRSEL